MAALARNALYNLLGAAAPALVSVATVPFILSRLGSVDYGLLTLITSIVGYFALLDINVTAGATKYVAEFNSSGKHNEVHATITFGLVIYAVIGLLGMVGLLAFARPLVERVFEIPPDRQAMALTAIQIGSLAFLFGQVQAFLQSVPGSLMRYSVSGRIEAAFGVLLPLLTVALLAAGWGLLEVLWLRVILCVVQIVILWRSVAQLIPDFVPIWPDAGLRRALLSFSAYAFLNRISALTSLHADKLIIGSRLGVQSLAYFAVPSTLVNRLMALGFRLPAVMFPHASALAAQGRLDDLAWQYIQATRYMFFLNGALAVVFGGFAYAILLHWLDEPFARQGAMIMLLIALAQWVDGLSQLPSLVTDGLGHPKLTGLFSFTRALMGLGLIAIGVGWIGIEGAAWGHLIAAVLMNILFLSYVHGRTVQVPLGAVLSQAYAPALLALLPGAVLTLVMANWAQGSVLALLCSVLAVGVVLVLAAWRWVMLPSHRQQLMDRLSFRPV